MTASNMGNGPDKNVSNAKEDRKLRKPLIEKRRRERINCSLEQLKGIMVDAYNLDHSKLEKADVLEVTVQHMEGLQRGQAAGSVAGFESHQRYSSGYIQCMHEVHNLLLSCPGMDKTLGARLLNHLLQSLPPLSSDTGSTGSAGSTGEPDSPKSTGSPNGVTSNTISRTPSGNVMSGGGHPPRPPCPASSPPSSPLSPPTRTSMRPRRLRLHGEPPAPPPSEAAGRVRGGSDATPSSSSSSLHSSPEAQPPGFINAGDASVWRPWCGNEMLTIAV
ncbi:hairy-related 8a, partial [Centroberyx affinis]|uniref:hairy-related 8a n=1 Tax=Centroberyx affinis TaxID=166261 RepID=UPI003A5C2947